MTMLIDVYRLIRGGPFDGRGVTTNLAHILTRGWPLRSVQSVEITREQFVDQITSWGLGTLHHTQRILWMYGPAGVGESVVAVLCGVAWPIITC